MDKLVRAASSFEITLDPSALNDLVNIVPADAFQPRFGVSDFMWDNLSSRVKTVLNFACETDYSKRYASRALGWATLRRPPTITTTTKNTVHSGMRTSARCGQR